MILWATASTLGFLGLIALFLASLPYSGGGGYPWIDFQPRGSSYLVSTFAIMVLFYLVALGRTRSRRFWFVALMFSFLPVVASLYSCWHYLELAGRDWLHPWEGSDVIYYIRIAQSAFLLSLIFSATLMNVCVRGFFRSPAA